MPKRLHLTRGGSLRISRIKQRIADVPHGLGLELNFSTRRPFVSLQSGGTNYMHGELSCVVCSLFFGMVCSLVGKGCFWLRYVALLVGSMRRTLNPFEVETREHLQAQPQHTYQGTQMKVASSLMRLFVVLSANPHGRF